jgi:TrmH family RNA methyltransferase
LFLVDGVREIQRAIASGFNLSELFLPSDQDALTRLQEDFPELASDAIVLAGEQPGWTINLLPPPLLAKLAYGERNENAVAVFHVPQRHLGDLVIPTQPLLVVLDRLEKPGNVGAIFRSADAAGVDGVILSDSPGDVFNPNCIRASAGTIFKVPFATDSADKVRGWLRQRKIVTVTTRPDAQTLHWDCDWTRGLALVIGNEAEGLGLEWSDMDCEAIRVPMCGIADSLNASVTAAICLFEAIRQRRMLAP